MIERFEGDRGSQVLLETLGAQRLAQGSPGLAAELSQHLTLRELQIGEVLIEQDATDTDVYFILTGSFAVSVAGKRVATRYAGEHVGEMAAVEPLQRRSATVTATELSVVARVSEQQLSEAAFRHPNVWRMVARELARRLSQRNALISAARDRVRVFIVCSVESLPIARVITNAFQHDDFIVIPWDVGVFKAAHYALESLEEQLDRADFAIAIAHADDMTSSRGLDWPTPRDNVIFELGFFMGRLGRRRSILMEPREEKIRLPSDLAGVTTIAYRYQPSADAAALMAPACNQLRDHIKALGPMN